MTMTPDNKVKTNGMGDRLVITRTTKTGREQHITIKPDFFAVVDGQRDTLFKVTNIYGIPRGLEAIVCLVRLDDDGSESRDSDARCRVDASLISLAWAKYEAALSAIQSDNIPVYADPIDEIIDDIPVPGKPLRLEEETYTEPEPSSVVDRLSKTRPEPTIIRKEEEAVKKEFIEPIQPIKDEEVPQEEFVEFAINDSNVEVVQDDSDDFTRFEKQIDNALSNVKNIAIEKFIQGKFDSGVAVMTTDNLITRLEYKIDELLLDLKTAQDSHIYMTTLYELTAYYSVLASEIETNRSV